MTQLRKRTLSSTIADASLQQLGALVFLALGIMQASIGTPHLIIFGALGLVAYLIQERLRKKSQSFLRHLLIVAVVLLASAILPGAAHAQFLQGAETFFSSTFTGAGEATQTVFGGLRGLYLIYLFISFIGVFNSVRQDEDWVAAARTPVIVIVSVTVVDILTQLVVGGGGGVAGPPAPPNP